MMNSMLSPLIYPWDNELGYFEKFHGKKLANGIHVRNHLRDGNFPAITDFWSEDMPVFGDLALDNCHVDQSCVRQEQNLLGQARPGAHMGPDDSHGPTKHPFFDSGGPGGDVIETYSGNALFRAFCHLNSPPPQLGLDCDLFELDLGFPAPPPEGGEDTMSGNYGDIMGQDVSIEEEERIINTERESKMMRGLGTIILGMIDLITN